MRAGVGDEQLRHKCLERMNQFKKHGKTILLVSHDLSTVRHFCSRVALLDHGKLLSAGTPDEVLDHYLEMVHKAELRTAQQETSTGQSIRWGSGEVQVDWVRMCRQNGDVTSVFDTNDALWIDAGFTVRNPVQGVVFGYQIFRSDGTYVHGSNHFWHRESIAYRFDQIGQQGIIRCAIPRLPLLKGHYYLTLCCYNQFDVHPQAVDHWERVCSFSVTERYTDQHGIFWMDSHWELFHANSLPERAGRYGEGTS